MQNMRKNGTRILDFLVACVGDHRPICDDSFDFWVDRSRRVESILCDRTCFRSFVGAFGVVDSSKKETLTEIFSNSEHIL